MVARTEQELSSDINRALFVGAQVNRRIPVETKFPFPVVGLRLDRPAFQGCTVDSSDVSTL